MSKKVKGGMVRSLSKTSAVVFTAVMFILSMPWVVLGSNDRGDASLFGAGVTAFEQKDYRTTIRSMLILLEKYPDTPLRDVALFWLANGNYKIGDLEQAALYMSILNREYPDSPLKDTERELAYLADALERGKEIVLPPHTVDTELMEKVAADKAAAEESHKAALQVSADNISPSSEADRMAAEKAAAAKIARVREVLRKRSEEKRQTQKNDDVKEPI